MADDIDAAVDPLKAPALEAAVDRSLAKSELDQLVTGDDPVLRLRQADDRSVRTKEGKLLSYIGGDCDLAGHAARLTAAGAPEGYGR